MFSANPQAPAVRMTLALLRTFGSSPSTTSLSVFQIPAPTSSPQQLVPPHTLVLSPNILPATQLIAEYMNAVSAAAVAAKPPLSQEAKADDSDLRELRSSLTVLSLILAGTQALVEKNRRKTLH